MSLALKKADRILRGALAKDQELNIRISASVSGVSRGAAQQDEDCAGVPQL